MLNPPSSTIREFIRQHVGCNQTKLVFHLLNNDDDVLEEKNLHYYAFFIANLPGKPFIGNIDQIIAKETEVRDQMKRLQNDCDKLITNPTTESKAIRELEKRIKMLAKEAKLLEDPAYMPKEVVEWLVITPWLSSKLLKRREAVLRVHGQCWWGRELNCPIEKDPVIKAIYHG